jgi:Mlc titration factor MtfA (ptsG expression regulator)
MSPSRYSLLQRLRRWKLGRLLRRQRIPESVWRRVTHDVPVVAALPDAERHRLRELASLFLHPKVIVAEGGMLLDDYRRALIAAQACLLVLHLSLDYFDGWSEVIVYPEAFIVPSSYLDESGVLHQGSHALGGEAWGRGPVILSWADIEPARHRHNHPVNVVLHEFAHKLDMLNGAANGMPPLHASMHPQQWSEDFLHAYRKMLRQHKGGYRGRIDPYAVTNPAEFFAVVTEFFFERPAVLQRELPAVYAQLAEFYRQDPLHRDSATNFPS